MKPSATAPARVAIACGAVLAVLAGAVAAQTADGRTFRQIQQRYHGMNEVHIAKCDRNGDELIERNELPCVQSIYRVMYQDR